MLKIVVLCWDHASKRLVKLFTMVAHCSTVISSHARSNADLSAFADVYGSFSFCSNIPQRKNPKDLNPVSFTAKYPCPKTLETGPHTA